MINKLGLQLSVAGSLLLLAACGSGGGKPAPAPAQSQGGAAQVGATVAATATATPTLAAQAATPASNPATRVSGTVASVAGNTVSLQDGSSFMLNGQTAITQNVPATATDIQSGRVVAVTAKQQPDNSLLASMVVVFPTPPGFNLSQFPQSDGNLMTNATVTQVNGSDFMVTFPGGGAQVKLAPGAKILLHDSATPSDIKAGSMVSASVTDGVARTVGIQ
jgi:hypothetical protein